MHDSRKTLGKIILDNLITVFNLVVIALLIILIINRDYLYIIPLAISLIATFFHIFVEINRYVLVKRKDQKLNIMVYGYEKESSLFKLKKGDKVVLYPQEVVNFVGVIESGVVIVDESKLTGSSALIEKTPGTSIRSGTYIVEGSAVIEVIDTKNRSFRKGRTTETSFSKTIKYLNLILSAIAITVFVWQLIFFKDELNDFYKIAIGSLPCLANAITIIYLFVKGKKISKTGINLIDETVLAELENVDVVCLDKSGTITTGAYEIFKTVVVAPTAFSSLSTDVNRGFDQIVSNIIRSTKEVGGYFSSLQERL